MKRKLSLAAGLLSLMIACGDDSTHGGGGGSGGAANGGAGGTPAAGGGGEGGTGGEGGSVSPGAICEELGLDAQPWSAGPYGAHRGDVADTFELELADGTTFDFEASFSGCESYIFVPDTLVVSELDATSLWEKDLDHLVEASPPNTHYFFVSRASSADTATSNVTAMQGRIDALLGTMSPENAEHWRARLHAVTTRAADLDNWVGGVMTGSALGAVGFAIDRSQRVRGVGFFADVARYSPQLANAGKWPWRSNLAYAANEAIYFEAQEATRARLAAEDATVLKLWDGEILEEFAETDVTLPSAEEMAAFDTLEIEIEQGCPNPDTIEFNNCGAWDYIASLAVRGPTDENIEIARFITSYHRETHWVVDVSAMLAFLKDGGSRHFRWDFAPSWNTQPTATKLSLRFSNQGKGVAPSEATLLWKGGPFDSLYNTIHPPVDAPIPADAAKVELFTLVTGHGGGTNNCSEFCNHQHHVTVGGELSSIEFPGAGTEDECMPQVGNGMVPNQGGTWWFGRGGWCPGKQVDPWTVDITSQVTPGQNAALEYEGLYNDADPPDGSGDIDLSTYLIIYR